MDHTPSFALPSFWGAPWKVEFRAENLLFDKEPIIDFFRNECSFRQSTIDEVIQLLKADAQIRCGVGDEETASALAQRLAEVGLLSEYSKGD